MLTVPTRWSPWSGPHLSDESLLELHALLLGGEHAVAARYQRHVKHCPSCSRRLQAVRERCDDLRRDMLAAVDARITPGRLDRQLDVIARRLEGHPGRVLPFPVAAHRPAAVPSFRRWVAMAAACGLLIGLGAGRMIGPAAPMSWNARMAPPGGRAAVLAPHAEDEHLLFEIDAALARSRSKEFRALDELTPRIAAARARGR